MMNAGPTIHRYQLLAGSLLVIAPLLAFAGPPAGSVPNSDGPRDRGGDGRYEPDAPGHFGPHQQGWDWGPHPAFLDDLNLTEQQEDKAFAILHAAAPALREQAKAASKAHEELRELGTSAQYDDARAKALTDAAGKADSELALLYIRAEHEIYSILTPEQRAQLTGRRRNWGTHDHDGHGPKT
jgi:Spy/CpxP family protein refolding chaperone